MNHKHNQHDVNPHSLSSTATSPKPIDMADITTVIFDVGGVLMYIHEFRVTVMKRVLLSRGYDKQQVEDVLAQLPDFEAAYFAQHGNVVDWADEKQWLQTRCQFVAQQIIQASVLSRACDDVTALTDQLFMLSFDSPQYQLFDDTVPTLQRLFPRFSLNVLSNATASLDWSLDLAGIRPYFEHVVISAYEQCEKPDDAIYHKALDRIGVMPSACVFIDDRIENVEAARALGMQAYHLDRSQAMTLSAFADTLLS